MKTMLVNEVLLTLEIDAQLKADAELALRRAVRFEVGDRLVLVEPLTAPLLGDDEVKAIKLHIGR